MAQWTDNSRTTLIEEIRSRPVLWDRQAQVKLSQDPNSRMVKHEAMMQVVECLNTAFYPHDSKTQYTADEVRSQWKNLKDTYKRKQRWLSEGKYSRDPAEEPTWKFFRLLKFLDKNDEMKDEGHTLSNDGEKTVIGSSTAFPQSQTPEEHALSLLFNATNGDHAIEMKQFAVTETIVARPAGSPHRTPSPTPVIPEPPRKRIRPPSSALGPTANLATPPLSQTHNFQASPFHLNTSQQHNALHSQQDEFHHFGCFVAATLRRVAAEGARVDGLKLQKSIADLLFDAQLNILQRDDLRQ